MFRQVLGLKEQLQLSNIPFYSVRHDRHALQCVPGEGLSVTLERYIPSEEANMQVNNDTNHRPEEESGTQAIQTPKGGPFDESDRARFYDELSSGMAKYQDWKMLGTPSDDGGAEDYTTGDGRGIRVWWNADGSFQRCGYFIDGKPCAMHHTDNDPYDALIDAVSGRESWVYPTVPTENLFPKTGPEPEAEPNPASLPTDEAAYMSDERVAFLLDNPDHATRDEIQRGLLAIQVLRAQPQNCGIVGVPNEEVPMPDFAKLASPSQMFTLPDRPYQVFKDVGTPIGSLIDGLVGVEIDGNVHIFDNASIVGHTAGTLDGGGELHPEPVDDGKFVNPGATIAARLATEAGAEAREAAPKVVLGENGMPLPPEVAKVQQGINGALGKLAQQLGSLTGPLTKVGLGPEQGSDEEIDEEIDEELEGAKESAAMERAADFWGTYLAARFGVDVKIVASDITEMQDLVDLAMRASGVRL
jgi:hypothetical protein